MVSVFQYGLAVSLLLLSASAANGRDVLGEPCLYAAKMTYNFGCGPKNDTKCLCNNKSFLQTVVACIDEHSSTGDSTRASAYQYMTYACKNMSLANLEEISHGLPREKISHEALANHSGTIDGPIELPQELIERNLDSKNLRIYNHRIAYIYSGCILTFMTVVILLKTLINIIFILWPRLWLKHLNCSFTRQWQKRIVVPALFDSSHSKPIGKAMLNLPTRTQSIVIFFYIGLNVVLACIDHHVIEPNYKFKTSQRQLAKYIGDRCGVLALSQIPLLILFGGRNNFLIYCTGWDMRVFSVYHKWIGRVTLAHLFVHAVCYTIEGAMESNYLQLAKQPVYLWGITGTVLGSTIFVQSVLLMRHKRYEIFVVCHVILAISFIITGWRHVSHTAVNVKYWYASVAIWAADYAVRIAKIMISARSMNKAVLCLRNEDVLELTFESSGHEWHHFAACYAFIYFGIRPWGKWAWQNHPFTVLKYDHNKENSSMTVLIKVCSGITKHVKNYLLENGTCNDTEKRALYGITLELPVLVEGPYGHKLPLEKYDRVVLMAGGIGATAIIGYVWKLKQLVQKEAVELAVHWVVKDFSCLEWFHDPFEGLKGVGINVYITRERDMDSSSCSRYTGSVVSSIQAEEHKSKFLRVMNVSHTGTEWFYNHSNISFQHGRPDISKVVEYEIFQADIKVQSTAIMSCGPSAMNDEIRRAVCHSSNTVRVDYYEEALSW